MKKIFLFLLLGLSLTAPLRLSAAFEDSDRSDQEEERPLRQIGDNSKKARVAAAKKTPTSFGNPREGNPTVQDYGSINDDAPTDHNDAEETDENLASSSSFCSRMISSCLDCFKKSDSSQPPQGLTIPKIELSRFEFTPRKSSYSSSRNVQEDVAYITPDQRENDSCLDGIFDSPNNRNSASIAALQAFKALAKELGVEDQEIEGYPILSSFLYNSSLTRLESQQLHLELKRLALSDPQLKSIADSFNDQGVLVSPVEPSKILELLLKLLTPDPPSSPFIHSFFSSPSISSHSKEPTRLVETDVKLVDSFFLSVTPTRDEPLQRLIESASIIESGRRRTCALLLKSKSDIPSIVAVKITYDHAGIRNHYAISNLLNPITFSITGVTNYVIPYQPCAIIVTDADGVYHVIQRDDNNDWVDCVANRTVILSKSITADSYGRKNDFIIVYTNFSE